MLKNVITAIATACFASIASADISILKLSLGGSLDEMQSQLIAEDFIFMSVTDEKIEARKLANGGSKVGYQHYKLFKPSTKLEVVACNGKVNRISYETLFQENAYDLMFARREIFQYLKDTNGQLQDIGINQQEKSVRVVEHFVIDRNAIAGSVKGEEKVSFSIDLVGSGLILMVRMENNWFCPQ